MAHANIEASELKGKIDFGIITIREDESEAILERFPHESMIKGRQLYGLSKFKTINDDEYQIAMVRCAEQGNLHAQNVARNLIDDLNPQWILVVGIAGTIPKSEHTLGDVVLATRVTDLCVSASLEGEVVEFDARGGAMHPSVQKLIAALTMIKPFLEKWYTPEMVKFQRPKVTSSPGNFYGDDKWKKKVRENITKYFGKNSVRHEPKSFTGSVISSDTLVKDTKLVSEWQKFSRSAAGIEMELSGVYQAAHDSNTPVLAIRGISDIVGFKRSDDWTGYACNTAAAFTHALLHYRPINPCSSEEPDDDAPLPVLVEENTLVKVTNPVSVFVEVPANPAPIKKPETLYSNLLEITHIPKKLFSVQTTCKSIGEIWAIFNAETDRAPSDWIFKGKTIYAFHDFTDPIWANVCDISTVEEHLTNHWSNSAEHNRVSEFIELLGNCLKQLGSELGIRYLHKQIVNGQKRSFRYFYYAATPDFSERRIEVKSLKYIRQRTVFKAHFSKLTGKFQFYKHSAFRFEFSQYNKKWYLEISPHYHYTRNGYKVTGFYEDLIKGMKRLDQNESVFRQVLFWSRVLQDNKISYPHLKFGELLQFSVQFGIHDDVWNVQDPISKKEKADSRAKKIASNNSRNNSSRTKNSRKTNR